MKAYMIALTALGLPACASTQTVLSKEPKHVLQSPIDAAEVAFCLGNKNLVAPLQRADGSYVLLLKNGYGAVGAAITVIPDGKGSRVEYRKQFVTLGSFWRECAGMGKDD